MSAYFTVYPNRLKYDAGELDSIRKAIENAKDRAGNVSRHLNGSIERVRWTLDKETFRLEEQTALVSKASHSLTDISTLYASTDKDIAGITEEMDQTNQSTDAIGDLGALETVVWPMLKKMLAKMPIAKTIMDFSDLIAALQNPTMASVIIGSLKGVQGGAYAASIIAKFVDGGWKEAIKKAVSASSYFPNGLTAGTTFTEYLKQAFGIELGKYHDFSDASKTAGTIAKWAGAVIEVATEGFENYEEFKDSGNWMRMFGEIIVESGTDIGLGIAATAAIGAAAAFAGISAPAIAVAAAGAGVVFLANKGCEWLTEKLTGTSKDIGEVVSDFVFDTAEKAMDYGKKAVDYVADTAKNVYDTISDGCAKVGKSISNWFSFGW